MEKILSRTLKDSYPKARVLRARELRVVLLLLFFGLYRHIRLSSHLSTIIAET